MKKMSLFQLVLTLGGSALLWWLKDQYDALSFLVGGCVILFSFISWGLGMSFIFQKKFIALSICIIVFKYAILGVIIYWLVRQGWLHTLWFALGVASFTITALFYAIFEALKEEKQDVI
jgi:hypothetical protein